MIVIGRIMDIQENYIDLKNVIFLYKNISIFDDNFILEDEVEIILDSYQ